MSDLFHSIKSQILEKSYAEIKSNVSLEDYQKLAKLFLECSEIDEFKKSFSYKVPSYKRGKVGYVLELVEKGDTDNNKEYFHYNKYFEEMFKKEINNCKHPSIINLLKLARYIYNKTVDKCVETLSLFESEFPGISKRFFPDNSNPLFILRILKYPNLTDGDFLAKAHYDRGIFTFALAESGPGLRLGRNDLDLKEVVHSEGKIIFMPSLGADLLTSKDFHPVWHDVLQREEHKVSEKVSRWAIVFFANIHDRNEMISYEQAHTPIYKL